MYNKKAKNMPEQWNSSKLKIKLADRTGFFLKQSLSKHSHQPPLHVTKLNTVWYELIPDFISAVQLNLHNHLI